MLNADTLFGFRASPCLLFLSCCCVVSRETTNTNFVIFGLNRRDSIPRSVALNSSTLTFTLLIYQTCFLTLYRSYKLKLNVSRRAWDTKVIIRNHYRRIEGQTLHMFWIKKTPPNKNKKQNQKTNKQIIVHKTLHIKQKIEHHETRVENREWTSAWFLHFRKHN